jgi:hypothetical protein
MQTVSVKNGFLCFQIPCCIGNNFFKMESLMKNLIVCAAFFVVAIGLSNVSMAECDTPALDRLACLKNKARVSLKDTARNVMCHVQKAKSRTVKAVKSTRCNTVEAVKSIPSKLRGGVKKAMDSRPKIIGCCKVPSEVTEFNRMLHQGIILPVAVMPEVNDDLVFENN